MNNPQDDRIAELYQEIPKARPSEILDARIRQEARKQLKTGKSHSLRWLSVAALMVLSVGVVLRIIEEVPVEQSLEESLEIMDMEAGAVLKEEGQAAIRADAFGVEDEKMKKAAEPLMDAAPVARMKRQQMPAAVEPAATARKAPTAPTAPTAPIAPEPGFSGAIQAESVDVLFLPENYCGMEQLRGVVDKQVLEAIFQKLLDENRLQQAECLKKLMNKNFKTTESK